VLSAFWYQKRKWLTWLTDLEENLARTMKVSKREAIFFLFIFCDHAVTRLMLSKDESWQGRWQNPQYDHVLRN